MFSLKLDVVKAPKKTTKKIVTTPSSSPSTSIPQPITYNTEWGNDASRFNSRIFIVSVGRNKQIFNVHESALSKSPVLARMCSGAFQESVTGAIQLPEDKPETFGFVLEFLYANSDAGFMEGLEGLELANKLANIYIMAEKYQLNDLKETVIDMLSSIDELQQKPKIFFRLARKIYGRMPDSDLAFRRFFCERAISALRMIDEDGLSELRAAIEAGDTFATDVFDVQRTVYEQEKNENSANKAAIEAERNGLQVERAAIESERKEWKKERKTLVELADRFIRTSN